MTYLGNAGIRSNPNKNKILNFIDAVRLKWFVAQN